MCTANRMSTKKFLRLFVFPLGGVTLGFWVFFRTGFAGNCSQPWGLVVDLIFFAIPVAK